jgi:hypothetical protein
MRARRRSPARLLYGSRRSRPGSVDIAQQLRRAGRNDVTIEFVTRVVADVWRADDHVCRGPQVFTVSVHFDSTIIVIRDECDHSGELDARRQSLLNASATRWSTAGGRDGRTILMELPNQPDAARRARALLSSAKS